MTRHQRSPDGKSLMIQDCHRIAQPLNNPLRLPRLHQRPSPIQPHRRRHDDLYTKIQWPLCPTTIDRRTLSSLRCPQQGRTGRLIRRTSSIRRGPDRVPAIIGHSDLNSITLRAMDHSRYRSLRHSQGLCSPPSTNRGFSAIHGLFLPSITPLNTTLLRRLMATTILPIYTRAHRVSAERSGKQIVMEFLLAPRRGSMHSQPTPLHKSCSQIHTHKLTRQGTAYLRKPLGVCVPARTYTPAICKETCRVAMSIHRRQTQIYHTRILKHQMSIQATRNLVGQGLSTNRTGHVITASSICATRIETRVVS